MWRTVAEGGIKFDSIDFCDESTCGSFEPGYLPYAPPSYFFEEPGTFASAGAVGIWRKQSQFLTDSDTLVAIRLSL